MWTVALGKILTMDNLRKQAILITYLCCMCKCNGESFNHPLLHCPLTSELWDLLFCLVGITWGMPHSVLALLESWRGTIGARRSGGCVGCCLSLSHVVHSEREEPTYF